MSGTANGAGPTGGRANGTKKTKRSATDQGGEKKKRKQSAPASDAASASSHATAQPRQPGPRKSDTFRTTQFTQKRHFKKSIQRIVDQRLLPTDTLDVLNDIAVNFIHSLVDCASEVRHADLAATSLAVQVASPNPTISQSTSSSSQNSAAATPMSSPASPTMPSPSNRRGRTGPGSGFGPDGKANPATAQLGVCKTPPTTEDFVFVLKRHTPYMNRVKQLFKEYTDLKKERKKLYASHQQQQQHQHQQHQAQHHAHQSPQVQQAQVLATQSPPPPTHIPLGQAQAAAAATAANSRQAAPAAPAPAAVPERMIAPI
eukprot:TRINITY_DN65950_c7_g1_i1.p2 TRINITY_DN65950_c7_g1~~TRINITY_DN65950_c7_g1_i1.p2  ORF type:complete len:316 (+),score=53.30 TRINITY_DN65950_c7_g1_i1:24-971(+)